MAVSYALLLGFVPFPHPDLYDDEVDECRGPTVAFLLYEQFVSINTSVYVYSVLFYSIPMTQRKGIGFFLTTNRTRTDTKMAT